MKVKISKEAFLNSITLPRCLQNFAATIDSVDPCSKEWYKILEGKITLSGVDLCEIIDEIRLLQTKAELMRANRDHLLIHSGRIEV